VEAQPGWYIARLPTVRKIVNRIREERAEADRAS